MYQSELWGFNRECTRSQSVQLAIGIHAYECIPERFGSDSEPEFDLAIP